MSFINIKKVWVQIRFKNLITELTFRFVPPLEVENALDYYGSIDFWTLWPHTHLKETRRRVIALGTVHPSNDSWGGVNRLPVKELSASMHPQRSILKASISMRGAILSIEV